MLIWSRKSMLILGNLQKKLKFGSCYKFYYKNSQVTVLIREN